MAKQDSSTVNTKNDSIELPPETDRRFSYGIKTPSKRKKIILAVLSVITAVVLVGGLVYLIAFRSGSNDGTQESSQQVALAPELSVESIENGSLELSKDGGVVWERIEVGAQIDAGDQIRTVGNNANTRVGINLTGDSWLRVSADTVVAVEENTRNEALFNLVEGRVYIRASAADSRQVSILKNGQSIGVNSAAFEVSAAPNSSQVSVFAGSVKEDTSDSGVRSGQSLDSEGQISEILLSSIKSDAFIIWNRDQDIKAGYGSLLGILEDFEAPDLSVISPVNGAQIEIASGSNSIGVEVVGSTESGASVKVASSSGASAEVTADEIGAFKVTLNSVVGSTVYSVQSTDRSGNTSELDLRVELVREQVDENELDITLGAIAQGESGIALNWSFRAGFEAPDGVQVLWNKSGNLAYPIETVFIEMAPGNEQSRIEYAQASRCDKDKSFGNSRVVSETGISVCLRDGESYSFRVCRFDSSSDSCDIYSNEVRIVAPNE